MTLTVLELIVSEGKKIGNIRFNSETGMKLEKEKIESPYSKWLANEGLLTRGQDYSSMGLEKYISNAQSCLKKNMGEEVTVRKVNLSPEKEMALMKYYAQK